MYFRLTISYIDSYLDNSLKTVDLNIDHIVYAAEDEILSIYDHYLQIFDIDISYIYYFAIIDKEEAGIDYKCYNNLDLAFTDLGFNEVEKYYL